MGRSRFGLAIQVGEGLLAAALGDQHEVPAWRLPPVGAWKARSRHSTSSSRSTGRVRSRRLRIARVVDSSSSGVSSPDHLHHTEPGENSADPPQPATRLAAEQSRGADAMAKSGRARAGGPVHGDAAAANPCRRLRRVGRPASPAGMIPKRPAGHRKSPLTCHLRVTPSPCVRSYRRHMKETRPAGRTAMAALRPAQARQGRRRSLPPAHSAPPGMAPSAAAAGRWLERK